MKDSWVIGSLSAVAILGMLSIAWQFRERTLTGYNDFAQLYAGARLVGSADLYDAARVSEVQRQAIGRTSESWRYTRLPYYAALLWPLGKLSYRTAYFLWEALALAAFAGFIYLWDQPTFSLRLLFSSLSLPAFTSLMNGQDLTFILLWIAIALSCRRAGRPFLAGMVFALCAAKYHLFLLAPLLLLSRREWRFGGGLLSGGAVLGAVSFAVSGPSWPQRYMSVLMDPRIHPSVHHMPNLHGLFAAWPALGWIEWLLAAAVAASVWMIGRRMSFEYGLAAALAGGLLTSYHAYLQDCNVLLPAALTVVASTTLRWLRLLAVLLLTPVTYFFLLADSSLTVVVPAAILVMIAGMLSESRSPSNAGK